MKTIKFLFLIWIKYILKNFKKFIFNEMKENLLKKFMLLLTHIDQLTTKKYPVDVSNFVSEEATNFKKINHINFSKF